MTMAAGIVEYTVSPEHAETLRDRVQAHLVPAAREAGGYRRLPPLGPGCG